MLKANKPVHECACIWVDLANRTYEPFYLAGSRNRQLIACSREGALSSL